jgi:hypothetical protein
MSPTRRHLDGCVEQHLIEKAKRGTVVGADVWFDGAEKNLASVTTILNDDANGAATLVWLALHNIAKGLVAAADYRLEGETHGKVVDFLLCAFPDLPDADKGLIRDVQQGRNRGAYDDPRTASSARAARAHNLAKNLLEQARDADRR